MGGERCACVERANETFNSTSSSTQDADGDDDDDDVSSQLNVTVYQLDVMIQQLRHNFTQLHADVRPLARIASTAARCGALMSSLT